jgi:hypothetical protein
VHDGQHIFGGIVELSTRSCRKFRSRSWSTKLITRACCADTSPPSLPLRRRMRGQQKHTQPQRQQRHGPHVACSSSLQGMLGDAVGRPSSQNVRARSSRQ